MSIEAMKQALEALCELEHGTFHPAKVFKHKPAITALRAAIAESEKQGQEPVADGLPMVIAGAIFDFAGYLTTREQVIEVGSTANASPMADLVKEWAALRGLSLADAAVLSWQELLLHTAPPQRQPLTEEEIALIAAASGGLCSDFVITVARAIEAKLKEKNT